MLADLYGGADSDVRSLMLADSTALTCAVSCSLQGFQRAMQVLVEAYDAQPSEAHLETITELVRALV